MVKAGGSFLLAAVLILLVASCNTTEKLLCRTWRVVDVDFDEASVDVSKLDKPQLVQQFKDSCVFSLSKEHTYSIKLPQRTETGVWSLSKSKDTIFSQNEHAGTVSKINVLSDIALDIDAYSSDGVRMKFVFAPVTTKK